MQPDYPQVPQSLVLLGQVEQLLVANLVPTLLCLNCFVYCISLQYQFRFLLRFRHSLWFSNLVEIYYPPTVSFGKKLFLKEYSIPSNKYFVLGWVVKSISFSFLRIFHKLAFIGLGSELIGSNAFHKCITAPYPHK